MAGKVDKTINENQDINQEENKETNIEVKENKEDFINVIAIVNLKYDKEIYKIGDEFKVRKADSKDMLEKEYIELAGE